MKYNWKAYSTQHSERVDIALEKENNISSQRRTNDKFRRHFHENRH